MKRLKKIRSIKKNIHHIGLIIFNFKNLINCDVIWYAEFEFSFKILLSIQFVYRPKTVFSVWFAKIICKSKRSILNLSYVNRLPEFIKKNSDGYSVRNFLRNSVRNSDLNSETNSVRNFFLNSVKNSEKFFQ